MRKLRNLKATALLGLFLVAVGASAVTEDPAKPLETPVELKSSVLSVVEDLDMKAFNIKDASVEIEFSVNELGEVIVEDVSGNNCVATTYVEESLKGTRVWVSDELTNVPYKVTMRYVSI